MKLLTILPARSEASEKSGAFLYVNHFLLHFCFTLLHWRVINIISE